MRYDTSWRARCARAGFRSLAESCDTPGNCSSTLSNRRVGALWQRLDRLAAQGGGRRAERREDVVAPLIEICGLGGNVWSRTRGFPSRSGRHLGALRWRRRRRGTLGRSSRWGGLSGWGSRRRRPRGRGRHGDRGNRRRAGSGRLGLRTPELLEGVAVRGSPAPAFAAQAFPERSADFRADLVPAPYLASAKLPPPQDTAASAPSCPAISIVSDARHRSHFLTHTQLASDLRRRTCRSVASSWPIRSERRSLNRSAGNVSVRSGGPR